MNTEIEKTLQDLARRLTRNNSEAAVLKAELINEYPTIVSCIEQNLNEADKRGTLLVPELRFDGNETVGVFSDYGGEHHESRYFTYSFLIFGWNHALPVQEHIKTIKNKYAVPSSKEISYKKLDNGPLARCLDDYLEACNSIAGMLFTVAVQKNIISVIGKSKGDVEHHLVEILDKNGFGKRKPKVAEKLLRIMHISAYLTAWLSKEGQKIFWMSDNDEIVPNEERTEQTIKLFQNILQFYLSHQIGQVSYTTPKQMDEPGRLLDFLSITDLAAGAVEGFLSRQESGSQQRQKTHGQTILKWLGRPGIGLKKHTMVLRATDSDNITSAELVINSPYPEDAVKIPIIVKKR